VTVKTAEGNKPRFYANYSNLLH